jgi:hypothetical protein
MCNCLVTMFVELITLDLIFECNSVNEINTPDFQLIRASVLSP